jgi:hypothetical protein
MQEDDHRLGEAQCGGGELCMLEPESTKSSMPFAAVVCVRIVGGANCVEAELGLLAGTPL